MEKQVKQNQKSRTCELGHEDFYGELTSRNFHFVDAHTQTKLRKLKVVIAGCGSTGGACIEALAKIGIENFMLADNGDYEISNLNRQHFRLENVGQNKAEFHKEELLNINPYINCKVFSNGIQLNNVEEICEWADFIFDAVDVTTESGMRSKLALHKHAKQYKKPIASALDLGFRQWGLSFDYRKGIEILNGKYDEVEKCKHPIKALFTIYPVSSIPSHCFNLFFDLLENKKDFASQLGCTSDLLSGIIVPTVIRFVKDGYLVSGWQIDQGSIAMTTKEKVIDRIKYLPRRYKFYKMLKKVS